MQLHVHPQDAPNRQSLVKAQQESDKAEARQDGSAFKVSHSKIFQNNSQLSQNERQNNEPASNQKSRNFEILELGDFKEKLKLLNKNNAPRPEPQTGSPAKRKLSLQNLSHFNPLYIHKKPLVASTSPEKSLEHLPSQEQYSYSANRFVWMQNNDHDNAEQLYPAHCVSEQRQVGQAPVPKPQQKFQSEIKNLMQAWSEQRATQRPAKDADVATPRQPITI